MIGSNYHDLTVGVNGLFTLFNLKISGEIFPFSVGPGLYSHFDHHDGNNNKGNDDEYTKLIFWDSHGLSTILKRYP